MFGKYHRKRCTIADDVDPAFSLCRIYTVWICLRLLRAAWYMSIKYGRCGGGSDSPMSYLTLGQHSIKQSRNTPPRGRCCLAGVPCIYTTKVLLMARGARPPYQEIVQFSTIHGDSDQQSAMRHSVFQNNQRNSCSAPHRQTAVTSLWKSKQLLLFVDLSVYGVFFLEAQSNYDMSFSLDISHERPIRSGTKFIYSRFELFYLFQFCQSLYKIMVISHS